MENIFSWFDSFFDEVITNVNDVPLTNFILDRPSLRQPNLIYTVHSSSFSHIPTTSTQSTLAITESDSSEDLSDMDYPYITTPNSPENIAIDINEYTPLLGSDISRLSSSTDISSNSIVNQYNDNRQFVSNWNTVQNNVIENMNRVRVLHELYNQPATQNVDYNYNINLSRNSLQNSSRIFPETTVSSSSINDIFTNFLTESVLNVIEQLQPTTFEDVKVTLDPELFAKLPEIAYKSDMSDEPCNICMENYQNNDILKKLPCAHLFHKQCISKWLVDEKTTCPICRQDVRDAFKSSDNIETTSNN